MCADMTVPFFGNSFILAGMKFILRLAVIFQYSFDVIGFIDLLFLFEFINFELFHGFWVGKLY